MKASVNLKPALVFLDDLARNNNKAWFDAHRQRYEEAKAQFEEFVQLLIAEIDKFDALGILSAKECIFRINRDVRFSKDKSPYKTNMGAYITAGGKKGTRQGYYFHIQPHNQSFLAGGLHMPTPEQLAKFRKAIDRDAAPFKKIIRSKEFVKYLGALNGEKLTTAPKGYPKDHPDIELLKLKEVVVGHRLNDKEIASPNVVANTARTFRAMKPFLHYLDSILK